MGLGHVGADARGDKICHQYGTQPPIRHYKLIDMKFDPQKHHRHSIRLPGYDYSLAGAYYVTLVAHDREPLFGEVVEAEMKLSRYGQIVESTWLDLPKHYPLLELDTFCIMPEHVHAILVLPEDGRRPLSEILRAFKSYAARRINLLRKTAGVPVWQRDYYEHIIRDNADYLAKRKYILDNPMNWKNDK